MSQLYVQRLVRSALLDVTAISIAYVNHGFVVAADGRCRLASNGEADKEVREGENDYEQKIFDATYKGQPFAYAVTGLVFSAGKRFNVLDEIKQATRTTFGATFSSFKDDVAKLASYLGDGFEKARADGRIDFYPETDRSDPGTIARVFLLGYFRKGKPSLVTITFRHDDQKVVAPKIDLQSPPAVLKIRSGSRKVADLVEGRDERFADFFRLEPRRESTLQEAGDWAKRYIDACCSLAAIDVDPGCKRMGGHVHLATLTPRDGFKWVIPPISQLNG